MAGWIGVDFDGTIAEYYGWRHPNNGKPIEPMVRRVKVWLAQGREVRIMTARVSACASPEERAEAAKEVQDWTEKHIGVRLPVTCEKDYGMVELWDDRAVQVEINTGRRMDGAE